MKQKSFDSLGRIHIPKAYREALNFTEDAPLEIEVDAEKGELVIRRRDYACMLCKKTEDLIEIKKGVFLCKKCIHSFC